MVLRPSRLTDAETKRLESYIQRCKPLGLDSDQRFMRELLLLSMEPSDRVLHERIESRIAGEALQSLISANPLRATAPREQGLFQGELFLGRTLDHHVEYRMPATQLLRHVLVIGATGGGKTNAFILILKQLLEQAVLLRVFDRKLDFALFGNDHRFVYQLVEHDWGNLFEPPPGVKPHRWIMQIAEIFANTSDIRLPGRTVLVEAFLHLCQSMNSEQTGYYPTPTHLKDYLQSTKTPLLSKLARYKESVINRLMSLEHMRLDPNAPYLPINWPERLHRSWAIGLGSLPLDRQVFHIAMTCARLFAYAEAQNRRSPDALLECYAFDEASTVFRRQAENREQAYHLTDLLSRAREFGQGYLIGSQSLTNLPDSLLANTATKMLIGGAGLGRDYNAFAAATGMNTEQRRFLAQLAQPGLAVVHDPRYPHPFLLEVPHVAQ